MPEPAITTYKGRPCLTEEMQVGNTLFTVISVQSENAGETAYDKVNRLILGQTAKTSKTHV